MIDADAREKIEISGLAGLDVKILTLTTTREDAILHCSAVMEEMGTCLTHINKYYTMMPDVDTELELTNLFRGAIGVEEVPNIDYDATVTMIHNMEYGAVRRGHMLEITSNRIPWVNLGNETAIAMDVPWMIYICKIKCSIFQVENLE